ncbi:DUF2145 domain-containing protein [Massilia endophytica]|uniref:DUF2145 domain-containing protein n=1 Tax=Massilia endophytica TaxID=2899220 RepID=UPI001E48E87C|nr:DUF2145 domain-containing protein [Massilia endophytica]UGQ45714.1 DUF2145 domain-containing protein [Massilia endophytica]
MKRLLICLLFAAGCLAPRAQAGQTCEEKPVTVQDAVKALDLAERSFKLLDESGAQVALISRAGQDLSKYGLRFSHMAIVWRDHPEGRWTVVHELNDCGSANSALYNEGLGNFFLNDMYRYEAEIAIPGEAVQQRLAQQLASRTPVRLHQKRYNMLSYAFSTQYQNSNQWVLENYAAAASPQGQVETREEAQKWLRSARFRPITVEVNAATRLGARMFRANVAFDDHPFDRRMAGQIDTVTTSAIVRFMKDQDPATRVFLVPAL